MTKWEVLYFTKCYLYKTNLESNLATCNKFEDKNTLREQFKCFARTQGDLHDNINNSFVSNTLVLHQYNSG